MPLYEYKCTACGAFQELQLPINCIDEVTVNCRKCAGKGKHIPMKRQIGAPALVNRECLESWKD